MAGSTQHLQHNSGQTSWNMRSRLSSLPLVGWLCQFCSMFSLARRNLSTKGGLRMRPLSDTVVSFDKPFGGPAARSAVPSIRSTTTSRNHDVLSGTWGGQVYGGFQNCQVSYLWHKLANRESLAVQRKRQKACIYLQHACVSACAMQGRMVCPCNDSSCRYCSKAAILQHVALSLLVLKLLWVPSLGA